MVKHFANFLGKLVGKYTVRPMGSIRGIVQPSLLGNQIPLKP